MDRHTVLNEKKNNNVYQNFARCAPLQHIFLKTDFLLILFCSVICSELWLWKLVLCLPITTGSCKANPQFQTSSQTLVTLVKGKHQLTYTISVLSVQSCRMGNHSNKPREGPFLLSFFFFFSLLD